MLNIKITSIECKVCGRKLTSPKSVAAGVGRTCAGGAKRTGRVRRSDCQTLDLFADMEQDNAN